MMFWFHARKPSKSVTMSLASTLIKKNTGEFENARNYSGAKQNDGMTHITPHGTSPHPTTHTTQNSTIKWEDNKIKYHKRKTSGKLYGTPASWYIPPDLFLCNS